MRQEEFPLLMTEIAFDAPQRRDDVPVDAIGALHRSEGVAMLLELRLAVGDALAIDEEGHVVPDRRSIFRLRAREAHRLLIVGDPLERPCRQSLVDAGGSSPPLNSGDTGRKISRTCWCSGQNEPCGNRYGSWQHCRQR